MKKGNRIMYISKRCFVRIISYLTAAIIAVGIMAAQGMHSTNVMKSQLEYNMT